MRHILHTTFAALLLALTTSTTTLAGAEGCVADWSVAAPIVKEEGLVTVEELSKAASGRLSGDIVKATLCRENGIYVFRLVVKGVSGQLRTVTVDARRPFGR